MKPDAAAKLNRLLRLRRIKRGAIPLCVILSMAVFLGWFFKENPIISETILTGTITSWYVEPHDYGPGTYVAWVTLESGDKIRITKGILRMPTTGANVQVVKRQMESGRATYQWVPMPPEDQ